MAEGYGVPARRIREAGLRVTAARVRVWEALHATPHSSVSELALCLGASGPQASLQTLHNAVNDLTRAGLLRRVELPGSAVARYETRVGDAHHHLQCTRCGHVVDVDCAHVTGACLDGDIAGLGVVSSVEVVFRGLCAECAEELA
ncbi:Transcriptional regulator, FUR family [Leucobacter sp. 7(1)]|uniref:Fur family transcriptional regulator n=1 Tax=Leucobacter sp. 7(1) TaxID=1255613 RepID=UPI00097F1B12|nr:Fur family transcriptional regulator [Leucobacter sp. 7(1)]SJN08032.1 Transcriptional regulator, FUR family [Leucobacter sp. 7(1)]